MAQIGRLKEANVRDLWKHEQYDFSEWLSKEENIEYLNDILGLTLVNVNKEVYVGPYRCDIVAKDESSEETIIIENQLEGTNHDHLGKIITYASGLDAKTIVWIVTEAKEEHRSAIEWLNNNTNSEIKFFLIEIHAYTIGNSDPAPKFEVIEKPNDFVKQSKFKSDNGDLSRAQSEWVNFWEQFNQAVVERGKPFNLRKARASHWYDVSIGTTGAHISAALVNTDHVIVTELHINDDKDLFDNLYSQKDKIDAEFGEPLIWDRLDKKKASRIKYYINGLDFDNKENYPELIEKTIDTIINMRSVFKKYM